MRTSLLWLYSLVSRFIPESRGFAFKCWMLRCAGAKIGRNVRIYSSTRFLGGGNLEIGDDVHIGPQALIYPVAPATVTIGSHIDIAPGVMILTGSHEINAVGEHIAGKGTATSVTISDGSWLGARSVILPGVSLAKKTVVGAGAVVTKSAEHPVCLLAGVPAEVKKQLCGTPD